LAAVKIHATCGGFVGEVLAEKIAPYRDAERPSLPARETLTDCLQLTDRGYSSVPYSEAA
jgi:hypothetical protein